MFSTIVEYPWIVDCDTRDEDSVERIETTRRIRHVERALPITKLDKEKAGRVNYILSRRVHRAEVDSSPH